MPNMCRLTFQKARALFNRIEFFKRIRSMPDLCVFRRWALPIALALVAGNYIGQANAQDKIIRFGASLSLSGGMSNEGRLAKDGYDFYVKLT